MSTININLPEQLNSYLKEQIAQRGCKDASEYVQLLIEADQQRRVKQDVEAMLLESVDGPFTKWTESDVDEIQNAGRSLIERQRTR